MAFVSLKPGTLLAPVPAVMVSCASESARPNIITVAWAGTVCSDPPMCSISVRRERCSHDIIRESGEFVINLTGRSLLKSADLCGVKSGRDTDKFALCGLTAVPAEGMKLAPAIGEAPLYLACRVESITELGSHDLFLGRIVSMGVRDDLMDEKGGIELDRAELIAFNHGVYYDLGRALGFFGFSVASPETYRRRMARLKRSR